MSQSGPLQRGVLASDGEREEIAERLQLAATEGRLTFAELDERLAAVYGARFRGELVAPVADLPEPAPSRRFPSSQFPLVVHAVLVVAVVVALLVHAVMAGPALGLPIVPAVWAVLSLLVHARMRRRWYEQAG